MGTPRLISNRFLMNEYLSLASRLPHVLQRSSTTCPLCRYTSAQLVRHDDSLELNLFPGAYVTHLSKHFSVSFATTSLKTALRFSS